jgi:(1->4)-alpha-D-glucan 1-alpha-D-glucosylmutase
LTPPRCSYRLQLLPHLDFERARDLVPYLRDLGVSHLYLSPSLQARSGSAHGYDVVDPTRLSEDLGGEEQFRALCGAGLRVILDIVPNHMAASEESPFWRDPLWRAKFFDLDWRTSGPRRFFDIGDLAGVRVEDPEVFEVTHAKVIELTRDGMLDGVRVDHVDGLANPARYLQRLRDAGIGSVWVEKILGPGEVLRDWPVEGTTGYQFAGDTTRLFIEPGAEGPLTRVYRELTGERRTFAEIAREAKLEQVAGAFEPEVARLRAQLIGVDDELDLPSSLASFGVYRTYVDPENGTIDDSDRAAIIEARLPARLADLLLLAERGHDSFVLRFQQTTPPVTAKGVEDTALYRYNRLLCLNEVGCDPDRFSLSVDDFHATNLERARRFPRELLTSQTHDTKRSGDARARLCALSWHAEEWERQLARWCELNDELRTGDVPDPNAEYFIYQTLVAAWPIGLDRLMGYLEKAFREAKVHTSWSAPERRWEEAVRAFVARMFESRPFLAELTPFVERLAADGRRIALGQTLLKLTCPGTPDIYQGDELWSFALVDPDNRRPVDWARRRRLLAELRVGAEVREETEKLFLIWKTLGLRARRPEAFEAGYEPLDAGPDVCAFMRGADVLVAVPLRPGATYVPPAGFCDVLDGAELRVFLLERL